MVATRRRPIDLSDYQGPHGKQVLTWAQLEFLFEEYLTTDGNLGELLVAIQIGDVRRAHLACEALIAGAKP